MEGPVTESDREAMLLAALSRVDPRSLRESLKTAAGPHMPTAKPVANAVAALRKQRDPSSVLAKAQYRVALPYIASVVSGPCLTAVIEVLGDAADDPTRAQLLEAIDAVGADHDDVSVTVMLASVAVEDMAASDLCFSLLDSDERFGVPEWDRHRRPGAEPRGTRVPAPGASREQREARRARKRRETEERRRRAESAARAADHVRAARKKERTASAAADGAPPEPAPPVPVAPTLGRRRAVLTPAEEAEFDRDDPWAAGVVLAWVPFDGEDPEEPGLEGKVRPCVVVAGSSTHLLVRPGYSAGGVRSRDWKSHPVRHWRTSGFDEPTWIDVESVRVERPETGPRGFVEPADWNALW